MKCNALCHFAISSMILIPGVVFASSGDTRVTTEWTARCPHAPDIPSPQAVGAALVAIMAPLAVSAAIDAAGSAIEASAKENTVTRIAKITYSSFYEVTKVALTSLKRGCLLVTQASYDDTSGNGSGVLVKRYLTSEISIQKIKGYPLYRLVPVYLEVSGFEDSSFWSRERRVDINVTLKGVGEDKPFASSVISFYGVRSGLVLKDNDARLALAAGDAFTLPVLSDVDRVKVKFAPNARNLVLAMKYKESGAVTDDYKVEPDQVSIFTDKSLRKAIYGYCKNLKGGVSDNICVNWWEKGEDRVVLQRKMSDAENNPSLIQARKDWAQTICPNYNKNAGLSSCPDGSGRADAGIFSTSVTLVTVRDSNKYGLALAGVLSKSSTKIGELSTKYLPKNQRAQEKISEEAFRTNNQKIYIALKQESLAQALLDEAQSSGSPSASDIKKAELDLLIAMTKTNDAYVAAGKPPPHTSL
jgi:hypothetical protein